MNIRQKVNQMKADLARMVNACNEAEDYRAAQNAQSCLQTVGTLSDQLEQGEGKTAEVEFK